MRSTVYTPAKLNVHLRVFPKSSSGYHPLRSWFRVIRLTDVLAVRGSSTGEDELLVAGDHDAPADPSNLILRAFAAIRDAGVDLSPVHVRLTKNIPAGGGLGGGSSDAAAALVAARELAEVPDRLLYDLAPQLGSDVPFFVAHHLDRVKQATCTGRGEVVEPIVARQRHSVLLILPELHLSTPVVFEAFDRLPQPADDGDPDFAAWSWLPSLELLPNLRNDLEAAAFAVEPSLGSLREQCEQLLARPVRMSGSGSTLFTLYDSDEEATRACESVDLPVASRVA